MSSEGATALAVITAGHCMYIYIYCGTFPICRSFFAPKPKKKSRRHIMYTARCCVAARLTTPRRELGFESVKYLHLSRRRLEL